MKSVALLEFDRVSKAFGDFFANQEISFSVSKGSIHALIGENGAGKSTLMKILFGLLEPDAGEIYLEGKKIKWRSPAQAKKAGFGMVHQHFMLAGPLLALDHLILDQKESESLWKSLIKPLPRKKILSDLTALSEKFKMPVPWMKKVENLSVGLQQRIEILKLLYNQTDILILDEPTAVLTPGETQELLRQLQALKAAGKTILLITHKLKEVLEVADSFTVLRQGRSVFSGSLKGQTLESLSELMIGRKLHALERAPSPKAPQVILEFKHVFFQDPSGRGLLQDLNFSVGQGEIVGIVGVEGNGQQELMQVLTCPRTLSGKKSGTLLFEGQELLNKTTRSIRETGLHCLPQDRLEEGLLLEETSGANFLLGQQRNPLFQKMGWIFWQKISEILKLLFSESDIRPSDLNLPLGRFSGGNQQKFVVARELYEKPKLLLAAQPTRGVDVGAAEAIHKKILDLKKTNAGVLLISSDLDELMKISDRLLILFRGKIVGELQSSEFDENKIGILMAGGTL